MTTKQDVCFIYISKAHPDTPEDQLKKAIQEISDSMTTINCVTPINIDATRFMVLYTEVVA